MLQTVNWKPVKPRCIPRGTGGDRDPRRRGKRYWLGPRFQEAGEEVLVRTEIPGGGGRGTGWDRDPRRRGKRYWLGPRFQEAEEEVLAGTEIPGGGGRGTGWDRDPRRRGKRETLPDATLSPPEGLSLTWAAMRAILMFH